MENFVRGSNTVWQTLVSDVANTGFYAWTVSPTITDKLRVIVSATAAAPWDLADTSNADNAITTRTGIAGLLTGKAGDEGGRRDDRGRG